ncbi:unnamed protein product [Brassicogethes aeneus]|uniref:Single domain-containing protein n=1 Tax=Brassicogethes aeneus TaxID=1431903 RepID=A0A9P0FJN5_BRAAE|nr:unnamed protein product [Brassicogethes aeneus]
MSKNYYCFLLSTVNTNCKMKFAIFTFVCLCAIVQVSFGSVLYRPANKTRFPIFCHSEETGLIGRGGIKQLPNCVAARCHHNATITLNSCSSVSIRGCKNLQDFTKPYPECCTC